METLPPARRFGRLGSVAGGVVGVAGFLTAIIELYHALYSPPDKVQIELQQQPIRVELVNPPAATPATAIVSAPIATQLTALPRVAPPVPVSAEPAPTATVGTATPLPAPAFRIATVVSTNETDGPRGRAALSFDGDPSTFYTFMAKSDPTVITVTPASVGAALKQLRYKVPAGIQLDNLVTEFVVETDASSAETASFRIAIDPYREGWQTIGLVATALRQINLRPQARYNGRLMSVGEVELR